MTAPAMRAIVAAHPGGPDVLEMRHRPRPEPGPGEVRIRIMAAGVNRPDLMQRSGQVAPPPGCSDILGLEAAGIIDAVGPGSHWQCGDEVMALLGSGGYADYCLAQSGHCLPRPAILGWAQAGAFPEAAFTVWHNLFERGRLQPGETVLIHGGASGVGSLAVQLAVACGARVLATASHPDKLRAIERLGAQGAINYRQDDVLALVRAHTGGRGVDVVLDIVGGPSVSRNLDALAPGGRHISLSFIAGARVDIDLQTVMRKGLWLSASTLRPQDSTEKARLAQCVRRHLLPLVEDGRVAPLVFAQLALEDARRAHEILESAENIGKVVLLPTPLPATS